MNSPTLLLRAALISSMFLLVSSTFATAAEEPGSLVAYIANAGNNNVQIVDVKNGATLNKLYTGTGPWRLTLTPDAKRLLVQNWYAETTAVVDLATNKIETMLPVRGPLIFDPAGKRMMAYSWPVAQIQTYDATTFQPLKNYGTEDKSVYDMVLWKGQIAKGQYDPVTKVGRKVYDNVLSGAIDTPKVTSSPIRSGTSPAKLVVDPSGDFLLTANFDDRVVSVLNEYGDGRTVTLAPGPRDIVFNKDGKQMIVVAWERHSAESDIFTLDTDFKERPWPKFTAHNAKHMRGGFVDAEMGADGLLYILDRPGNRLLVINPDTLAEVKSIPTGDEPASFVLRKVSGNQYRQLAQKTADRKLVEDIFAKLKAKSKPFKDVAFTEAMTHAVIDEEAEKPKKDKKDKATKDDKAAANKNSPKAKVINSVVKTQLLVPDAIRQETESGLIRIAEGGRSMAVTKEGRFADAPRQELLHVLYALPGLSVDEIIRQLAGDVPGSPFLRNGIAVDVVNTVDEGGHKFYAIGTSKRGDPVSQLWINAEDGLPLDLIEQYPIIRTKNPHGDGEDKGFQGITETKLHYHEVDGRIFPVELERYIDAELIGTVSISNIDFDQNPAPGQFSLAALGNIAKPAQKPLASDKAVSSGPGLAVVGQGNDHIDGPLADHVAYNTSPPTSGPHTAYLADWGVHKFPVPQEVQTHNLEDGGVMVQYACDKPCDDLVKQLEELTTKYDRLIVAPYPLMTSRITLTAWQRIETLDAFDEKRIAAFIEAYMGKDHHLPGGEPSSGESDPYALPPMHPRIEK